LITPAPLNKLEQAALEVIAANYPDVADKLKYAFDHCQVSKRENTGGGFFTYLESEILLPPSLYSPLGDARFNIDGMICPLECLLFHKNGRIAFLEGYAMGGDNTANIDFSSTKFSLWSGS
jgi:hypothetical protein